MTRKNRVNKQKKGKEMSQTAANDALVRKQGLGIQSWKQNSVRQPVMRLTSSIATDDLVFAVAANANFMCMQLYAYDVVNNEYVNTGSLVGDGPILWGEYAEQFQALAFLYELYRMNDFGFDFAPATLAGYGSQAGGLTMLDPTGVLAADMCSGVNLDGDVFRGISDAKNLSVVQSFKKLSRHVNVKDLLLAQQQQQMLMTKDPESATLERQLYQTGQEPSPPQQTRSYPPAIVGWMRFDLAGWDPSSGDRDIVLGNLKFNCNMTFQQRRIQWPDDNRSGNRHTPEFKLALASSFVGKPLIVDTRHQSVVTPTGSTAHQAPQQRSSASACSTQPPYPGARR